MGASLTVITGPMFSGKSEELIRRIRRAEIAKRKIAVFKPLIDTRSPGQICTRNNICVQASEVESAADLLSLVDDHDVVAIDEVQFFDERIVEVAEELFKRGKHVYLAALHTDYRGKPFGYIPQLMAIPEAEVVKLTAVCMQCMEPAHRTQRITPQGDQIQVGDKEYEARCHRCHITE